MQIVIVVAETIVGFVVVGGKLKTRLTIILANSNLIEFKCKFNWRPGEFLHFFSLKGSVPLNNWKLVLRSNQ